MDQSGGSTDLIFFAMESSLGQNDTAVTLLEGEQMHRGLPLALVSERSAYGFAIHRRMAERLFPLVRLETLGSVPPCSTALAFSGTPATAVTICSASQRANASL
jgi:hypothetical protein